MSELYEDDPRADRPTGSGNRSRALIITGVVLVVAFFALTTFASFYTDRLWFADIGYSPVFNRLLWTKIGLFAFFAVIMGVAVGINIVVAYRNRPLFHPQSSEQSGLDRYRDVVTPIRTWLLAGSVLLIGLFAGTSGSGQWRTFMLWRNAVPFGRRDEYFGKDIGFFVFDLPWYHYLTDFVLAASAIGLIAAAFVHYLYGGIRLQSPGDRLSGAAQAQLSVLLGIFVLAKAADYFLDRYDLAYGTGGLLTGITATDDKAVLPAKSILMGIAIICAILFFVNVWRKTWLLPSVGIALLALSAILLGVIWPGIVQQFQVKPSEPNKEASFIAKNIEATRTAYDLTDVQTTTYAAPGSTGTGGGEAALQTSTATTPVIDPKLVRQTFDQNQQARAYYSVAPVLDVDRYDFGSSDGGERPVVLGARELDQSGISDTSRNWSNLHTVYTHGSGLIAAYANQVTAAATDNSSTGSNQGIVWAEGNEAGQNSLTDATGGYEDRIYFGEKSPDYSVVGKAASGDPDNELDLTASGGTATEGDDTGQDSRTTYDGKGGIAVGSTFRKLLYAVKFGESNFLLSSRVNDNSEVLYDRTPRERVEKVAPWLTLDSDAYPAVVDGRVQWILDGYTTTDRYPGSQRESFKTMTDDSLTTDTGIRTLPTDEINYMRNAVKATVDAYDGTVKLYAWDESDPILKAWEGAFPNTIQPKSAISDALMEHLRYPEDLFKVQRFQLARYHVTDPGDWYQGNNRWDVPEDPTASNLKQPPYRLFVSQDAGTAGSAAAQTGADGLPDDEAWSLTSVFVPYRKNNLASVVSVDSDATSPDYGTMRVIEVNDEQTPGPGQISNALQTDDQVRGELQPFQLGQSRSFFGNLLTVPTSQGLVSVQPVYAQKAQSTSSYPILQFVLVSFEDNVGIGNSLSAAIQDAFSSVGTTTSPTDTPSTGTGGTTSTPGPTASPGPTESPSAAPVPEGNVNQQITRLLQQASAAFTEAQTALEKGDLAGYQVGVTKAKTLTTQALALDQQRSGNAASTAPSGSPTSPSATPSN